MIVIEIGVYGSTVEFPLHDEVPIGVLDELIRLDDELDDFIYRFYSSKRARYVSVIVNASFRNE